MPTYEELVSLIQNLNLQLKEALLANERLLAKIVDLEEKLNTNSSNSSKPSSQDPYRQPKKQKPSGKSQGAQTGHKGHARKMVPADQISIIHDLKPADCPNCKGSNFDEKIVSTDVRQVIELPEAPPQITQYNIHTCRCGRCGKHVKANVPNEAQYGFGLG